MSQTFFHVLNMGFRVGDSSMVLKPPLSRITCCIIFLAREIQAPTSTNHDEELNLCTFRRENNLPSGFHGRRKGRPADARARSTRRFSRYVGDVCSLFML